MTVQGDDALMRLNQRAEVIGETLTLRPSCFVSTK